MISPNQRGQEREEREESVGVKEDGIQAKVYGGMCLLNEKGSGYILE